MKRKWTIPVLSVALAALSWAPAATAQDLVVGWAENADTLNPVTTAQRNIGPVMSNIFDTLVWLTPTFEVEPLLAEKWTVSADGLVYTFDLRKGVTFHDGTPFDAAAVVANIGYITDEKTQSKISIGLLGPCRTAEATAQYQVKITCSKPYAALLPQLGEPYLGIQSPKAIAEYGADLGQHPVGTGPFKFVSWQPSQSIVVERFAAYDWMAPSLKHKGPADIARIVFQIVPNAQARVSQFQSGQSQVMQQTPGLYWKTLGASGRFNAFPVPISGLGIFSPINASRFPLDDVRVRRAVMHAIDRTGVIQLAEAGVYPVSKVPLTEGMLGYDPSLGDAYPYDPEKAMALLREAGWTRTGATWEKDGKTLSIKLTAIADKAHYMALAQAMQGYLSAIGIDARLEPMSSPAWTAANIAGEMQMTALQYIAVDPDALRFWFAPDQFFNWSHWSDPAFTALLDKAVATQDPAVRAGIYKAAQKMLLDNAVIYPLRQNLDLTMAAKNVTGITWSGGGFQYFGAARIGK
jgi:peptide/nickel transport system substrate-binding protein